MGLWSGVGGRADRKAAMAFIYVTIVLDTLGFGFTFAGGLPASGWLVDRRYRAK